MDTPPGDTMLTELRVFLTEAITLARAVAEADTAWNTPWAHSPAGTELATEEASRPEPETGSWPWQLAPMIARWALQVAAAEATGFSAAVDQDATSYSADVLCRGILETSSLAWWLLDPGIGAERRLARSLVYRLHSAGQTERAVSALELGLEDNPAEYGETVTSVQQEIRALGWTCSKSCTVSFGHDGDKESWPGYTERAASLVTKIWPQRKLPYAVLSAVAHGELLGLQRNLVPSPPGTPGLRVTPDQASALWLWQDTYLVLGALVFTTDRAAAFLGLREQLAALNVLTEQLDQRLPVLRPDMPLGRRSALQVLGPPPTGGRSASWPALR